MPKLNRLNTLILILLAAGVWSLVVIQLVPNRTAQAQARKQYGVWAVDANGKLAINGDGSVPLTASGLVRVLDETPRLGWRINTVVYSSNGGGYTVIVEK